MDSRELFTGPVFFGSPCCRDKVSRAHAQLDEAFNLLGGLQQPAHCDSEECAAACEAANRDGRARIRELAQSLVFALGVQEVLNQGEPVTVATNPPTNPPATPPMYYADSPPHFQMPPVPDLSSLTRLRARCRNLSFGEPSLGVNVALNDGKSHTVRAILTIRIDPNAVLSIEEISGSDPTMELTAAVRDHIYARLCERAFKLLSSY